MPKIIKDIEITITNSATELFVEHGYTNIDMRMISKKCGIAVGTLYNYYKNKKQLYIAILKESWQLTFTKLDAICNDNISSKEKLNKFITMLYEDIEARKGLGRDLLHPSISELKEDPEVNTLKLSLVLKTKNLLNGICSLETFSTHENINTRLAESLLMSTLAMYEFHPNDKEDNINFLIGFISLSLK